VLGLLAHDLRWTIVGLLADSDLRTGELVARTGQAPSLVSYHLGRLRDAGLVSARRSTADGRDSYHTLDLGALGQAVAAMTAQVHPGLLADVTVRDTPAQVLFICSGNSSRSPMAEGWLNHLGGGRVTARSAGVTPGPLHPLAVAAMAEHGVDISGHQPAHMSAFTGHSFSRVITLCDRAREECGELPGAAAHWSIPNPAEGHPPDIDAFLATARELRTRVRYLLSALSR
jgi:protein-tyrosine-phosphatase/DNA-binding transcriptional ArsR family regulator